MSRPTIEGERQMFSKEKKTQELLRMLTNSKDEIITVKVPQLQEVRLTTDINYIDVQQGTTDWLNLRTGEKLHKRELLRKRSFTTLSETVR